MLYTGPNGEPALGGATVGLVLRHSHEAVLGQQCKGATDLVGALVSLEVVPDLGPCQAVCVGAEDAQKFVSEGITKGIAEDEPAGSLAVSPDGQRGF